MSTLCVRAAARRAPQSEALGSRQRAGACACETQLRGPPSHDLHDADASRHMTLVALRMIPTQTLVAALCQRLAPGASLRTVRIGQRAAALCESALVG